MREKIKNILERELERLDAASLQKGLDDFEIRSLMALIKAYQEFMTEAPKELAANSPERTPDADLLDGITDE